MSRFYIQQKSLSVTCGVLCYRKLKLLQTKTGGSAYPSTYNFDSEF